MSKVPFLILEVLRVSQDSCSPEAGGKKTSLQYTLCHQEGLLPTLAGNSSHQILVHHPVQ